MRSDAPDTQNLTISFPVKTKTKKELHFLFFSKTKQAISNHVFVPMEAIMLTSETVHCSKQNRFNVHFLTFLLLKNLNF